MGYSRSVTKRPQKNAELIRQALGKEYLELSVTKLEVTEDVATASSHVRAVTVDTNGVEQVVEGDGCGLVDALFSALRVRYAVEYQSLETIELADFSVEAQLDTKQHQSGSDAMTTVSVDVKNSHGAVFNFSDSSRSITSSTAKAVLAMVEYFVNAERAFIVLSHALMDAKERNRADLITRYTREIAEVVRSTSYAKVIDTLQKEMGEL